jgi:hypothetical protein
MAEIKSTLEKVLERAATMGNATRDEFAAEERVKDGMRMGADYLRGKEVDFSNALEQTNDSVLIKKGVVQAFLRNITLPRDDDQERAEMAMQGLLELGKGTGSTDRAVRPGHESRSEIAPQVSGRVVSSEV